MLQDEEVEQKEVETGREGKATELSSPEPKRRRNRRKKAKPAEAEETKEKVTGDPAPNQVMMLERPHRPTWYLPGKVGRVPVQILVDTGCTTNLMSKKIFDKLDKATRETVEPHESYGVTASGAKMPFFGLIKTSLKIRHFVTEETFVVGDSDEDIILGMSFLTRQDCSLDFRRGVLELQGKKLMCTDRQGRPLVCKVQVYKEVEIPPFEEVTVAGRVPETAACLQGVIEGQNDKLLLAASLNQPDEKGRILLRCLNPSNEPMKLAAGTVVGEWYSVEEQDIQLMNSEPRKVEITGTRPVHGVPEHLGELYRGSCDQLEHPDHQGDVARLLCRYQDVFSKGEDDVGLTKEVQHDIPVFPGTRPIKQPPHRLGPEKEAEVQRQIEGLLEKGLIEPACGAWSSPVVLVRKKDGTWRFCVDYRKLNAVTQYDAYPLPRIDESLDALSGSRYFSTLDLVSGYWQVPLTEDAKEKSTFTTRNGLWRWKVLPFGLTSAPATFQRLMEKVLQGLHWKTLLLYLDDVIVIAPDFESHLERLEEVFKRLRGANLKLKPSKCELFKKEVRYLGHVVSSEGVSTDPEKVEAVKEWQSPTSQKDLQSFLGLAGYYRQYIPDFSTIAKPLSHLTSKDTEWEWNEECQQAFEALKCKLVEAPVLGYPDPVLPYILDTDASAVGVGAVLSQVQDGKERVIAYFSKTLSPPERNYCVTRRELLAVIKAVGHFKPYLYGRPFTLRTDHASLMWLCQRKEPSNQVARWLEILSEFRYKVEHRPGNKHGNADALSRKCTDCRQCNLIEQRDGGPTHDEIARMYSLDLVDLGVSLSSLWEAQADGSSAVAEIYRCVKVGLEPTEEQLEGADMEFRRLAKLQSSMRLTDQGILQVCLAFNNQSRWCTICPKAWRSGVVQEAHVMAHAGVQKTIKRLQLNWYWPGMTADVRRYIGQCEICQRAKTGGLQPAQGRRRLYAGRPWQKVAVDLVGPMPETPRGNKWILVISDHFTRWQDAFPLPDATAPTVATTLEERVFCYLGLPEQIHSDQGAQFEGELMAELCDLWGIQKTRTSPYHPQGNGVVERGNRTLGDSLRALLLSKSQDEWDRLLPQVMRAFRATPHSVTGETANSLLLGREVRLPYQLVCPTPLPEAVGRSQYVSELTERLEHTHELVRNQQRELRQQDGEEPLLFRAGDYVWLENRRRRKGVNQKLQAKFVGPYEVLKAFPNHTYEICRQGQKSVQSEQRLKKYTEAIRPAGRAPGELEVRRRPNMKGAVTRQTRKEEVPVPPEEVIRPPEIPDRDIQRTQSPGAGPTRIEPSEVGPSRADPPAPRPSIEPELPPRRLENAQDNERIEETDSSQGAEGGATTCPREAKDKRAPEEENSNSGRPKRSAKLPRYLQDFELYKLGEGADECGKVPAQSDMDIPDLGCAKFQSSKAISLQDRESANQGPQEMTCRQQEMTSRQHGVLEGKSVPFVSSCKKADFCVLSDKLINLDNLKAFIPEMDKRKSQEDGRGDVEGYDRTKGGEIDQNREETGENYFSFDINDESTFISGLTNEEEEMLDKLLDEGSGVAMSRDSNGTYPPAEGNGRPVMPTYGPDIGVTTPKKAKIPVNSEQTVAEKYGFPWIRIRSRTTMGENKVSRPSTGNPKPADPAPGRPLPRQLISYKESLESKKRRLDSSASATTVVEPVKEVNLLVSDTCGVGPTQPGDPAPASAPAEGCMESAEGPAPTTQNEPLKCTKLMEWPELSRSRRRVSDLPATGLDSSDTKLNKHRADLSPPGVGSSASLSYRDVLVSGRPIEVKSLRLPTPVVGGEPLELEDNGPSLDETEPGEITGNTEEDQMAESQLCVELERLKQPYEPRTRWLSQDTQDALTRAIVGPNRDRCRHCAFQGSDKRTKVHVAQHFLRQFCRCGTNRPSRDVMLAHRNRHLGNPAHGKIHEVDRETYPKFAKEMGWKNPPPFERCVPTLGGSDLPHRDARDLLDRRRTGQVTRVRSLRTEPPPKKEAKERKRGKVTRDVVSGEGEPSSDTSCPVDLSESVVITRPKKMDLGSFKIPMVNKTTPREPEDTREAEQPKMKRRVAETVDESINDSGSTGQKPDIPCTVTAPAPSTNSLVLAAAEPESWRMDMLAGAAMLRQHAALLQTQLQLVEKQAEEWERKARQPMVPKPDDEKETERDQED